ncbi:hypothetical protein HF576_01825 [Microbacterium sp. CFH 90308]|uniref:Uncharacterized protein n=1 Tax=Microbacterium salsuginis TaxID=2722803 RepID=A0ABX1K6E6_9MICO|nr:hypothetical protein [Microbacterium sp. CFH 90308]NLP82577.1 hypothetical protein [Microbacterium sp. CFH 90308]
MELNWIAVLVAVLGAGGIGAAIREIASVVSLARKGVSGKEDKRREDIIAQRDHALALQAEAEAGERAADARADRERDRRIAWQEHAAHLRYQLRSLGVEPGRHPSIEDTENPLT